ncbi:hypothetical protein EV175_004788, partial [Coemansia sp. RSA 1933]
MGMELFRHRIPLQCPWNALAILFFYKWHILKEPPPDFEDPSWADQPLFGNHGSASDDYLDGICGELYREYEKSISNGQNTPKHIRKTTHRYLVKEKIMDPMFQGAISAANTMYVTIRFLQKQTFEMVQIRNSGFDTRNSSSSNGVLRQQYSAPTDLEHTIFPFAETIPEYDVTLDDHESKSRRDTVTGFCNMLKMLRTVLIQDMGVLFDVPFYRRMMHGNALMCADVFQREDFWGFSDTIRHKVWFSDFLPLVELAPKDPLLSRVRWCSHVGASVNQPTSLEAPTQSSGLPALQNSTHLADHLRNGMAMTIEGFHSPPCTPKGVGFVPMDMLDICSISSTSPSPEAEVQQHVNPQMIMAETFAEDGAVATKKRRISVQSPNYARSSHRNNIDDVFLVDDTTVPDIQYNAGNSVVGGVLVTTRHAATRKRQLKHSDSQQTFIGLIYGGGAEKENHINNVPN